MELVILDEYYREESRYSNFSTLAWNLRYKDVGDFQLRTYDVADAEQTFYLGMIVGITRDASVMQVQNIATSRDSTGNIVVEVTGKTPDSVFEHRPAVKKLVSQNDLRGLPWQYGNVNESVPIDSYTVLKDLFRTVDITTYGSTNESHLRLPFDYQLLITTAKDAGELNRKTFYDITPDMNALQVLKDVCDNGGIGYAIQRYGTWFSETRTKLDPLMPSLGRDLGFVFYRPADKRSGVTFNYQKDDYSDYSYSNGLHPTTFVLSDAGEVKKYRLTYFNQTSDRPSTGLSSWVDYTNGLPASRSVYEKANYLELYLDGLVKKINEYARDLSITTDGTFPYDDKNFRFAGKEVNDYYLGDVVNILYPYKKNAIPARVKEFIRTQDINGYREYPVFEPVNQIGPEDTALKSDLRQSAY